MRSTSWEQKKWFVRMADERTGTATDKEFCGEMGISRFQLSRWRREVREAAERDAITARGGCGDC